jgi:chitodextrinase
VKPQQPTGLHVTGRSQTAVSLDWNQAHDDTRVTGYIVSRDGHRAGTTYGPDFTVGGLVAATTYHFSVIAFDAAGNLSPASATIVATTLARPDIVAPTVPAGLVSTGRSTTSVVLVWTPSTDNVGVAGYDVFRGGIRIASVAQPFFTDTGLTAATSYTYTVSAFDTTNNASRASAPLTVSTLAVVDRTPPSAPAGLTATPTSVSTVGLSWSAATDNVGVTGYVIFRDGKQIAQVPDLSYADDGLTPATSYTYQVKAIDAGLNVSAASNPASATTLPLPPPPSSPTPSSTPTTPTPTDTGPPPPPPAPTVTGISMPPPGVTPPTCTATVSVTVTVTGGAPGAPPITLNYSIVSDGVETDGQQQLTFTDDTPQTFVISPIGDGVQAGSASVTDPASGMSASTSWPDDPTCANPQPTDSTGGTGAPTG